jgi:hypothetical protein
LQAGEKLLIDNDFVSDSAIVKELIKTETPTNKHTSFDFRKIKTNDDMPIHPVIAFDGIGQFSKNGNITIVYDYNNIGRFTSNGGVSELDLRGFNTHYLAISDASDIDTSTINLGEFPELEIIRILNCRALDIQISTNNGRRLALLFQNTKYIDLSAIASEYDIIDISIVSELNSYYNDKYFKVLAEKNIICGGTKALTFVGSVSAAINGYRTTLENRGWTVTVNGA